MKISLITVCYNAASTLGDTINSVLSQDYDNLEYIVIDGGSTDGTKSLLETHKNRITKWISEPDKGIYDAMNKGLKLVTGDIVGMINADDFYVDNSILSKVAAAFADKEVDAIFGDLVFVDPQNISKVVRKYSSSGWRPEKFAKGFMPAHPTFFTRKKFYDQFGLFKTDYRIAADYELLIRFLYVQRLRYKYLPLTMVKMRKGGVSSNGIKSNIILNNEIIRACRENGISTNQLKVYAKYFRKLFELRLWH